MYVRVKDSRSFPRRLLLSLAMVALLFPTIARAQAVIKVNDNVNFRFGTLIQAWGDAAQDATTKAYAKNLFMRRMRIIIAGQVSPNITFFFQTDNPNLGKAPKNLGSGFITQDAYVEWKPTGKPTFMIDAGLMLPPLCRDCLGSAAGLLSLDYNSWSFIEGPPTQSSVGRDTGVLAKGYLAGGHFEYRAGAFQGFRGVGSRNGFRYIGRAQYNVWETEVAYVYPEAYLGNKKILAIGGAIDKQQDYKAYTADVQLSLPIGVAKNGFNGILTLYHFDGGKTFTTLSKQRDAALQLGYYLAGPKAMPFFRFEDQNFRDSVNSGRNNKRYQAGLGWYPNGNNFNVKGAYTRVSPKTGNKTNQFTVQMQYFYF
jgi:hypothetical protein